MVSLPNCKDYSRLTVDTCYFADASILMKVPKGAFQPAPEVDSAVVKLVPRPAPFEVKDESFLHGFCGCSLQPAPEKTEKCNPEHESYAQNSQH